MTSLRNSLTAAFIFISAFAARAQQPTPWMMDKNAFDYQEITTNVDPRIHLSCEKEIIDGEYDRFTILWRVINLTGTPVNVDIQVEYDLNCKKIKTSQIKNLARKPINPGADNAMLNDNVSDPKENGMGWRMVIMKSCNDGQELKEIKITKCTVTPIKSKDSGASTDAVAVNTAPQTPEDKAKEQADKEADKVAKEEAKKQAELEMKQQKEKEALDQKAKKDADEKAKNDQKAQVNKNSNDKKAAQDQAKKDEAKAKEEKKTADAKAKQDKKDQEAQAKKDKAAKDAQAKQDKKAQQDKAKADDKARKEQQAQDKKGDKSKNNKDKAVKTSTTENAAAKEEPAPAPEPIKETPVEQPAQSTTPAEPAATETTGAEEPEDTLVFKDDVLKIYASEFREKAANKVRDLNAKLKFLVDASNSETQMNRVLEEAVKLFVDENRIIQVSNLSNAEVKTYHVRSYLTTVKTLQFTRINIEWTKIEIATAFKKQPDGSYIATAQFEQKFEGYRDEVLQYSDVTEKKVEIIIRTKTKIVGTESQVIYEVFLGDIGVMQTKHG